MSDAITASAEAATVELWRRLHRPFSPAGAVEAMTGLSPMTSRQLVGIGLATSPEADILLGRMNEIVRSLSIATTTKPIRSVGEVRGPVMWSETLAARSASPGAGDVFICAAPSRAYDTEENRVLVHALLKIRDAARDADVSGQQSAEPDDAIRLARHNGARAIRSLEHRTLASVAKTRPDGRGLRKARSGAKAKSYKAAVSVLDRAGEPIGPDVVVLHSDDHTQRQHGLLLALQDRFVAAGLAPQEIRVESGTLRAGPLRYLHRHRADSDGLYGVLLGNLLVDVPGAEGVSDPLEAEAALGARSQGRPSLMVLRPSDVDRAFDLAGIR
jgi:hypothetical protein